MDNHINLNHLFTTAILMGVLFILTATFSPAVKANTTVNYNLPPAAVQLAWWGGHTRYYSNRYYRYGPRYYNRGYRVVPRYYNRCWVNRWGVRHCN